MDLSKIPSTQLYLIRTPENAQEIDAELDRRNAQVAQKFYGQPKKRRRSAWRMVDTEYELARMQEKD